MKKTSVSWRCQDGEHQDDRRQADGRRRRRRQEPAPPTRRILDGLVQDAASTEESQLFDTKIFAFEKESEEEDFPAGFFKHLGPLT